MGQIWTHFFYCNDEFPLNVMSPSNAPPQFLSALFSGRWTRLRGRRQLAMRDKRRAAHNESSCQLFRRDKRKTEAVSLMTLAVPNIAPAHCCHNATLVHFFAPLARCSFWWFLRWAEEVPCSACNDNSRQNKTASLCRFTVFSHIRHWTCCVPNKYANYFAGGHWTTRRLFSFRG